ncbi:chorismate--pyruvate lyase family protein [Methylophaga sp. OBS3]|uniref:chorismate--pyruvate lyase family protein n=1 Tax=Methylophaga sp. OBS3 TaxID=2991934 RepID=UPI00225405A0|nr:chorismate lyase [Methylophaga sp. OBS3]MCX4190671.1 chorismate lyase [Methylophaga sp. OBS3]
MLIPSAYPHWLTPPKSRLPENLADWLQDAGSLTVRLKAHSEVGFSVQLRKSSWQKSMFDEALALGVDRRQKVFCREVCLMDGETPRVFARTVVPLSSYPVLRMGLSSLGTASLGHWLFSDPAVTRGPIQVSLLPINHLLCQHACDAAGIPLQPLWARRSCFLLRGKKLLVNEVFLPTAEGYPW